MSIDKEKLNQLQTLLTVVDNSITKREFAVAFKAVYDFVVQIKAHNEADFKDIKGQISQLSDSLQQNAKQELTDLKENLNTVLKDVISEIRVECDAKMQAVDMKMDTVRSGMDGIDGMDGKDADEQKVVRDVLEQLPKLDLVETQDIVAKLERLKGDKRLDASAIKNLPTGKGSASAPKSLRWLNDITNAHTATDGQVLVSNGDKTYSFEDATGGGVDTANSPNANEFARFTDADTIEGRTVSEVLVDLGFTASITELNYTDGVTSAIQTQLDAKQPLDTQLTALAGLSYTGNALKYVRINAGENGFELASVSGGTGITRAVVVTSGSGTMGATAATDYVYLVAAAHTMTLPTAVSNTNRYTVKNNHSAAITVDTTSSQTIDGTTTITINPQSSVDLISDNANWNII